MKVTIDVKDGISEVVALECVRWLIANGGVGNSTLTEEGVVWVVRKKNNYIVYKDKN